MQKPPEPVEVPLQDARIPSDPPLTGTLADEMRGIVRQKKQRDNRRLSIWHYWVLLWRIKREAKAGYDALVANAQVVNDYWQELEEQGFEIGEERNYKPTSRLLVSWVSYGELIRYRIHKNLSWYTKINEALKKNEEE
jgi:hypothetical protein